MKTHRHKITKSEIENLFIVDEKLGKVYWRKDNRKAKAGKEAGHLSKSGYWKISHDGKTFLRSRIVYTYVHGECDDILDHKNLNKSDDKITNLRAVSPAQNSANRMDVAGYSYHAKSNKYQARIYLDGRFKSLGYYADPRAASLAYLEARIKSCEIDLAYVKAKRDTLREELIAEGVIL